MTDQQHPITPPNELVQQWAVYKTGHESPVQLWYNVANQAARWGDEQRLEACIAWLEKGPYGFTITASAPHMISDLRAASRPKPPSLAEQALEVLNRSCFVNPVHENIIRAAIERLQELEKGNE